MRKQIKKHPLITYFIIAFGWTWGIVLAMLLSGQVDVNSPTPFFAIGGMLCNISPSLAALIVSRISVGKEGTGKLRAGFRKKVSLRFTALAIFTVPAVTVITAMISSRTIRSYEFQFTAPMLVMGLIWPLFSGFGEEVGWRGYLLPKMIRKFGLLKAGILLGIVWEVWHIPMHYMAYQNFGVFMIPAFLVIGFINLTLQTVIMTYLFTKSGGSIRLMILYHYTITSSSIVMGAFFKMDPSPKLTVYESILSVALFMIFAVFLYAKKDRQLSTLKEVA